MSTIFVLNFGFVYNSKTALGSSTFERSNSIKLHKNSRTMNSYKSMSHVLQKYLQTEQKIPKNSLKIRELLEKNKEL